MPAGGYNKEMEKKFLIFLIGFLFILNIYAWQEVFVLASEDSLLKVYFLDVGQGDSQLIVTPENHQILVDGGQTSAVLEKLQKLMPFSDRTIDLVILTHPERDHMQGLIGVLQRYKVKNILWTGVLRDTSEYQQWISVLAEEQKQGAEIATAQSGQTITAGSILITILNPYENLAGQELKDSNDSSVVFRLSFNEMDFLFTGDISTSTEKDIIERNNNLQSEVLKVAHHGSKYSTSEEFLENIQAEIAVVSVGKNSYGHPTPETLQKLEKFGIHILRTDLNGDISIISDGNNLKLITNN
jgi:competence protein ComEC